jgi:hypothetical protein
MLSTASANPHTKPSYCADQPVHLPPPTLHTQAELAAAKAEGDRLHKAVRSAEQKNGDIKF